MHLQIFAIAIAVCNIGPKMRLSFWILLKRKGGQYMNLCFKLSDEDTQKAKDILKSEIEYCVPADLNITGKMINGWFVVGYSQWLYMEDGVVADFGQITDSKNYKLTPMTGNAYLECETDGKIRMIVRISMKHIARFSYIAQILNQKSCDEKIRIYNGEDELHCPKCGRPMFKGSVVCPLCAKKTDVFIRILKISKSQWFGLTVVGVLLIIFAVANLFNPYLQKLLIDFCLDLKPGQNANVNIFWLSIGGLFITSLITVIMSILSSRIMVKVSGRISTDLRSMIFNKLQTLSIGFLSSQRAGDIINRIGSDTERIRGAIMQFCGNLVVQLFTLISASILMFTLDWKMALIVIIPAPLVGYLQYYVWVHVIHKLVHKQWKTYDKANTFLHDALSGIRVVKAFGTEENEIAKFKKHTANFAKATIKAEVVWSYLSPVSNFIIQIGQIVIMFVGSILIMQKHMTIGGFVQFLAYSNMIYGPLTWLMFLPRMLGDAAVASERIFSVIDEKPEIIDSENALTPQIKGNVNFKNVTFGYHTYEPVLKEINLDVKEGEMIGLVGHSGSGKSTLVSLVTRFYDINEGSLEIDGIDLRQIEQHALRSQIGVVLQEPFLFNGTIYDNIRYSKPDATLEEVIRAAKTANAHDFIVSFADGYDTKLDENGNNLSGGERQRISIARAVLNNPRILILDEATSALDTETESLIQEALRRLIKNRTTFAIAHRLATLKNADRLVVLEKGKVVEVGTHNELLKKKSIYYSLVMAQREMTKQKSAG
jgi:ATP-binding cassette subfamily B protein